MADVLLGLGGNLGDPAAAIAAAIEGLKRGGVAVTARSGLYRTPPQGLTDQPDFLNAAVAGRTALNPRALLDLALRIEAGLGRVRGERWGPRVIDIDLLAHDEAVIDEPGLRLPHPLLTTRAFVLVPLMDVAPDRVILGRPVRDWAAAVDRAGIRRVEATAQG